MRLLLTTDTIGGVWNFTETLVGGLLREGHMVALVSFGRQPTEAQSEAVQRLEAEFAEGFRFVASEAPLEWMDGNERAWEEGSGVLLRMMEEFAPELLHANQMCFGWFRLHIPVLVTAHSDVLSWAESTLPDGVEQLERTASAEWLRTYRALVKAGLEGATAVVAPTRWMADAVARVFDLEHVPGVIANGVAGDRREGSERKLQAVTAGRLWDEGKGLAVLDGLELPLPLLVVGEPQRRGHGQWEAGAAWVGALAHEELLDLFAESAMYVATSVYEPFGLAPVEAAKQGCAMVARDLPSFREVWGDAALYFTSAQSLQEILDSLSTNPRRLQGAQCRARQRAARYTAEAMTGAYLSLYEDLLARSDVSRERVLAHA